jgi:NADPH2:quinone reductase
MSKTFKGFRIHEIDGRIVARFDELTLDDLAPGDVVVRVLYSDINYKDALAATGAGRILRRYPLVGGIDLAGVVESSSDPRCKPGDHVLVTGCRPGSAPSRRCRSVRRASPRRSPSTAWSTTDRRPRAVLWW